MGGKNFPQNSYGEALNPQCDLSEKKINKKIIKVAICKLEGEPSLGTNWPEPYLGLLSLRNCEE